VCSESYFDYVSYGKSLLHFVVISSLNQSNIIFIHLCDRIEVDEMDGTCDKYGAKMWAAQDSGEET
jgi:hypothetical protein